MITLSSGEVFRTEKGKKVVQKTELQKIKMSIMFIDMFFKIHHSTQQKNKNLYDFQSLFNILRFISPHMDSYLVLKKLPHKLSSKFGLFLHQLKVALEPE